MTAVSDLRVYSVGDVTWTAINSSSHLQQACVAVTDSVHNVVHIAMTGSSLAVIVFSVYKS